MARTPPLAPDLARLPITHDIRALSVAEGMRAALSVAVIIAASEYLHLPSLRVAAFAALFTCLCDPGGPIRRRLPVLLSFAILGAAISGGLGLIRGLGPAVALPAGVLALFAASFAGVYGQAQQQLGALLSIVIVFSLDRALPTPMAMQVAAAFGGGAVWAVLLTLVIWRQHPYRATRQAVSEVYRKLAALTADLHRLARDGSASASAWELHARTHRRAVREAIETARAAVLETLRGRGAGSLRASQGLIRLETGDQIFGALIALSDLLEHGIVQKPNAERAAAERMSRAMRPILAILANVALSDPKNAHPGLQRSIDAMESDAAALPPASPLRAIANRLVERLRIAHTLAVPANFVPGVDPRGRRIDWRDRVFRPLRANLAWRSPTLRHAVRVAVVTAPALGFTMAWFTPYDHWLGITIVATMQPFFAPTFLRALERIGGAALGGLVAAAVGLLCTTPLSISLAMFPLAVAALAVRAVNFGLFMLALTPVMVLLTEIGQPDTAEWRIALARAALTIAGGLLAVAGSFVLWPSREPERLVAGTREAIATHGRYAEAEFSCLLGEIPAAAADLARRDAGLTSNALEASINRALIERNRGASVMLEAVLVIDATLRRFVGRLSAMRLDPELRAAMPPDSLRDWRAWIGGSMRSLAEGRTALPVRPDALSADAPLRLARQIELMAGAMERLTGSVPTPARKPATRQAPSAAPTPAMPPSASPGSQKTPPTSPGRSTALLGRPTTPE
jgi:uncharacterized membrane protein YccC